MAHDPQAHQEVGHVVPVSTLFGVLGALLVLTVITVAVTYVHLGVFNLAVALLIAVIKGSLVLLFFMHLRWDRPFNAVVFISALVFLAIFIGLALLDSHSYQPEIIPGYAPQLSQ